MSIIAISIDDKGDTIQGFWKQNRFTFPAASDADGKVFTKFATGAIPRTYLIDTRGHIVYQSLGYTETEFPHLLKALDAELLKPPGGQ